jgi:hypothetical protein
MPDRLLPTSSRRQLSMHFRHAVAKSTGSHTRLTLSRPKIVAGSLYLPINRLYGAYLTDSVYYVYLD